MPYANNGRTHYLSAELDCKPHADWYCTDDCVRHGSQVLIPGDSAQVPESVGDLSGVECKNCREPSTSYHMTYNFELGDALDCKGIDANGYGIYDASADTKVSQSQDIVTVRGRPYAICDPAERISFAKFRSAKCLYLWRCGKRPLQ